MSEKVFFRGKEFVSIKNSTIEHDLWLMNQIRASGLDRVHKKADETAEMFAVRLLHEVISSGRVFPLLGGLLIPAGVDSADWTPAIADETAEHLRRVTEPDEKKAIQATVVSALISFFVNGLVSATTSRSSSSEGRGSEPESLESAGA